MLPTTTECLVCGGNRLRVLPDHLGGEWLYCESCRKAGDTIQFASWTWDLPVHHTIKRLSEEGFDISTSKKTVQNYFDYDTNLRKRILRLWEKARAAHLHDTTDTEKLLHALGMYSETPSNRWEVGPGALFGRTQAIDVEAAYFFKSIISPWRRNPSKSRIFWGKNWRGVLIFPFWDLPGRISGFHLVGRYGKKKDMLFYPVNYGARSAPYFEAGLHFHPESMTEAEQHWKDKVFVTSDILFSMRLQARHFECRKLALPVFTYQAPGAANATRKIRKRYRTHYGWRMLAPYTPVFWMPKLDLDLLQQAAFVDGEISTVGPREPTVKQIQTYISRREPAQFLQYLMRTSNPWEEVFVKVIDRLPSGVAEQLGSRIAESEDDLLRVMQRLPRKTRDRLARVMKKRRSFRVEPFGCKNVVEEQDKWLVVYPAGKTEVILWGTLRIDHVIYQKSSDTTYLKGRLTVKGHELEFLVPEKKFQKNTFDQLQDIARKQGHVTLEGKRSWSSKLLEIATIFHTPEYIEEASEIGWNADESKFVLPNFNIKLGGKIESGLPELLISKALPATELEPPDPELRITKASKILWATVAPILANIVAPPFAHNPSGIALLGNVAQRAGSDLSQYAGCLRYEPGMHINWYIDRMRNAESAHRWPLFVGTEVPRKSRWWSVWIDEEFQGFRNCIASMHDLQAFSRAFTGGWHIVFAKGALTIPGEWRSLVAKLVPAYLFDLAQRNFQFRSRERYATWLDGVLQDLAGFVETRGGNPEAVLEARSCLWPDRPYGHAVAFGLLLAELKKQGRCVYRKTSEAGRITLARDSTSLLVPDSGLRNILCGRPHHVTLPEHQHISKMLEAEGVLVEDLDDAWRVDKKWWNEVSRSNLLRSNHVSPLPQ